MPRDPQQIFSRKNNERLRELLATILSQEISDPRLELVTITSVDTAPDTRSARVYISCDPARYTEVLDGLHSAHGRIQSLLGRVLGWKYTPELRFEIDKSIDTAAAIDLSLRGAAQQRRGNPAAPDADAGVAQGGDA
ncbi:MAG: 30S ribosome-binding factor RbfA [Coriobacteriia bacterium]|nr:30S ribosome-binding factor RbfA [Coriobacteriia bacterium]